MYRSPTTIEKSDKQKNGFTLIEVSVSLIILGIMLAFVLALYTPYMENKKIEKTQDNLESIYAALEKYRADLGFYPCPAPLTHTRDQASYGASDVGECQDVSVAVGSCAGDNSYCIRQSLRSDLAADQRRVRIGAVPFRDINVRESQSYDAFGNRFFYAVSESMARGLDDYDSSNGAINVINSQGTSLTGDMPGSANIFVFSVGENRRGGYDVAGNQNVPCNASYTGNDNLNCAVLNDATFRAGEFTPEGVANEMDDYTIFQNARLGSALDGWRKGNDENSEDVTDVITDRRVKIGSFGEQPMAELDITGEDGDIRVENILIASDSNGGFCDVAEDTGNTNCFRVADFNRICPPGEYVVGIGPDPNQPGTNIDCDRIAFRCPQHEMLVGIDPDGQPICEEIPPPEEETETGDNNGTPDDSTGDPGDPGDSGDPGDGTGDDGSGDNGNEGGSGGWGNCPNPPCEGTCMNPPCPGFCSDPPCTGDPGGWGNCENPPCEGSCLLPPCEGVCFNPPCEGGNDGGGGDDGNGGEDGNNGDPQTSDLPDCGETMELIDYCPDDPTIQFETTFSWDCNTNEWVNNGSNQAQKCCNDPDILELDPLEDNSETHGGGVCGFGTGFQEQWQELNPETCEYGPVIRGPRQCTCNPATEISNGPPVSTDYDPDIHNILTCAQFQTTYFEHSNGRCYGSQGSVVPGQEGTWTDGSFVYNAGDFFDSEGANNPAIPLVGSSCPINSENSPTCREVIDNDTAIIYSSCPCVKLPDPMTCY